MSKIFLQDVRSGTTKIRTHICYGIVSLYSFVDKKLREILLSMYFFGHSLASLLIDKKLKEKLLSKLKLSAVFLVLACAISFNTNAQYSQYQIKGAMVYNFAKYITWPPQIFGNDKMIIAVLGDNPFGEDLERIVKNRQANGRLIEIRYGRTIKDIKGSHVVFFCRSEESLIEEILESYKSKFILTVGDDIEDFCELGGIINLSYRNNRPSFSINLEAAQKAGLIIDTKLLQLAEEFIRYEKTKQQP